MQMQKYAPVCIPTLNRFEHFKRCLESLELCTDADKTDLYVGLDYPPSEKYVEGWKKIDLYLREKEKHHGFKNLYVRRRDYNCGVGTVASNGWLLLHEIRKVTDRYIFTEDDNEFSPNFLDYMNKALETFKDNPKIYGICGYNYYNLNMLGYDYEYYYSHEMSAWGWGSWFNKKCDTVRETVRKSDFLFNIVKTVPFSLFMKNNAVLCYVLNNIGFDYRGDANITYYQRINNMFCVFPSLSLVRNYGHDGSGLHSGQIKGESPYANQRIDTNSYFNSSFDLPVKENKMLMRRLNPFPGFKYYIKNVILLTLIKLFVKLRNKEK